jgi:hypothetical protein
VTGNIGSFIDDEPKHVRTAVMSHDVEIEFPASDVIHVEIGSQDGFASK